MSEASESVPLYSLDRKYYKLYQLQITKKKLKSPAMVASRILNDDR